MFDIAWSEYLLIIILAVVLLGPKELPVVLGTIGRWIVKFRQLSTGIQEQLYNLELESSSDGYKKSIAEENLYEKTEDLVSVYPFPQQFNDYKAIYLPSVFQPACK